MDAYKRHTSQEQNFETEQIVKTLVKTIETNKNFSKLIVYALTNLKSYLLIPTESQAIEYSSIILKSNFLDIIEIVVEKHINDEELLMKVGDVLLHLMTQSSKQKETIKYISKTGLNIFSNIFDKVDINSPEVYKIFIKILNILIDDKSFKYDEDLEKIIKNIFSKFEKNDDIIIYLLELITSLFSNKANIELFSKTLLNEIVKIISNTDSEIIGNHCIHILDILSNETDLKENIRHYKSISFIIKLLTKFQNNTVLTFRACNFLTKIIEKEDVLYFIKIMKINNVVDLKQSLFETGGLLGELEDLFKKENFNDDNLNVFKKHITRVLTLLCRDKYFSAFLNEMNCFEVFLSLFKNDLTLYIEKSNAIINSKEDIRISLKNEIGVLDNVLPEFLKLILNLLKNYDENMELVTANNDEFYERMSIYEDIVTHKKTNHISALIQDLNFCLVNSLIHFYKRMDIVEDIFKYILTLEGRKNQFTNFIKDSKDEEFNRKLIATMFEVFKVNYDKIWMYELLSNIYAFLNRESIYESFIKSLDSLVSCLSNEDYLNFDKQNYIIKNEEVTPTIESSLRISKIASSRKGSLLNEDTQIINNFEQNLNLDIECILKASFLIMINFKFSDENLEKLSNIVKQLTNILEYFSNSELIKSSICFIFCILDSNSSSIKFDFKTYVLDMFFKKESLLNHNITNHKNVYSYIIFWINKLNCFTKAEKIERNNPSRKLVDLLFQKDYYCSFLLHFLQVVRRQHNKKNDSNWEELLKDFLNLAVIMIKNGTNSQIEIFLKEGGIIYLCKIFIQGVFDFDCINFFVNILEILMNSHTSIMINQFRNYLILKNFVEQLKEIHFSLGFNEKIFCELLLFFKTILKSLDYEFFDIIQESNIIDHLIKEFNEIYYFYLDSNNKILLVLTEIFYFISKDRKAIKILINSQLPATIATMIGKIEAQTFSTFSEKMFGDFIAIISGFLKTKTCAKIFYVNYTNLIEILKIVLMDYGLKENLKCFIISFLNLVIEYENADQNLMTRTITKAYFKDLILKSQRSTLTYKNLIEKSISYIENPEATQDRSRYSRHNRNKKLIKELDESVLGTGKLKLRKKTKSSSDLQAVEPTDETKHAFEDRFKNNLISIDNNPNLLKQFTKVLQSIGEICDNIIENPSLINAADGEQISELIKSLHVFTKDETNLKRFYESELFNYIILILEFKSEKDVLILAKNQAFILFKKMIYSAEFINFLFKNKQLCLYFVQNLSKILDDYCEQCNNYIHTKYAVIASIISKLSSNKDFLSIYAENLNEIEMYKIISKFSFSDEAIVTCLLKIFNNILIFKTDIDLSGFKNLSSDLLIIWGKFPDKISVVEQILQTVEFFFMDELLIKDLLKEDIVCFINLLLSTCKINVNNFLKILEFYNKLGGIYPLFLDKLFAYDSLSLLMDLFNKYSANTAITEITLSIFLKGCKQDKKYITFLSSHGVLEYSMNTIMKYMNTCHLSIITQSLELIFILINGENNILFYSKSQNINMFLQAFKINIKMKEVVSVCLKLFNIITLKDFIINSDNFNFTTMVEIINDLLDIYSKNYTIFVQIIFLIQNLFQLAKEIWLKKLLVDIIYNNTEKYLKKVEFIEIITQAISNMLKQDYTILDLDSQTVFYFISKIISSPINSSIITELLKLLKFIVKNKYITSTFQIEEINKYLKLIFDDKNQHKPGIIAQFSSLISLICTHTTYYSEMVQIYFSFILECCCEADNNSDIHNKLLEEMKIISVYTQIKSENESDKISNLLFKVFNSNFHTKNKKNLTILFQIISSICIQSELVKEELNKKHLADILKDLVKNNCFNDNLLDYQAKGCLLNLKEKSYGDQKRVSNVSSLGNKFGNLSSDKEIKLEVRKFLTTDRNIKLYSDKGEVKKRILTFSENIETMYAIKKNGKEIEIHLSMHLKDMESCVRGCATAAFSKAKGFFTRKPKGNRCFAVLGIKTFEGQNTFNVECENEEDSIKYVDYISILIQRYKSIGEERRFSLTI